MTRLECRTDFRKLMLFEIGFLILAIIVRVGGFRNFEMEDENEIF